MRRKQEAWVEWINSMVEPLCRMVVIEHFYHRYLADTDELF